MKTPSKFDVRRVILDTIQPLSSGIVESVSGIKARLSSLVQFGDADNFTVGSAFGLIGTPAKGVIAYFMNLAGSPLKPIIVSYLDRVRPVPSGPGEVIVYCTDASGATVPITIKLGTDGALTITALTKFVVNAPKTQVNSDEVDVTATTVKVTASTVQVDSGDVELGNGSLEKVLKGETFQAAFNAHTHHVGPAQSGPPDTPSTALHLSTTVKAG